MKPRQDDQHRIDSEQVDERKCTVLFTVQYGEKIVALDSNVVPVEVSFFLPDVTKIIQLANAKRYRYSSWIKVL